MKKCDGCEGRGYFHIAGTKRNCNAICGKCKGTGKIKVFRN